MVSILQDMLQPHLKQLDKLAEAPKGQPRARRERKTLT